MQGGCGGKNGDEGERLSRLQQLKLFANEFVPGATTMGSVLDMALEEEWLDVDKAPEEDVFVDGSSGETYTVDDENAEIIDIQFSILDNDLPSSMASKPPSVDTMLPEKKDSATSMTDEIESAAKRLSLAQSFLDESALYSISEEDTPEAAGVRLMTMHAAKGLEFDVVFVPGCNEGLVPLVREGALDRTSELEEETRLFFVSLTRAKKDIRLMFSREHSAAQHLGLRKDTRPSRFLRDILQSGFAEQHVVQDNRILDTVMDKEASRATRHMYNKKEVPQVRELKQQNQEKKEKGRFDAGGKAEEMQQKRLRRR